jgi:OOP family OmpA-OmpF porin
MTHTLSRHLAARSAAAVACLVLGAAAHAQSTSQRSSWIPYTTSGYVGLNVGQSDYRADCAPGSNCDDSATSGKLYVGGMFNEWLGLELGYVHLGEVDRSGGVVRAHGVNVSLVGKVPMGNNSPYLLYGRLGTTYGRTKNESPIPGYSGTGTAWKPAWGVGVGYQFTPQWAVVLDYDEHRFDFPRGTDRVGNWSLGVRTSF